MMVITEFDAGDPELRETLQQICAGIKEAQSADGGGAINAESAGAHGGNLFSGLSGKTSAISSLSPASARGTKPRTARRARKTNYAALEKIAAASLHATSASRAPMLSSDGEAARSARSLKVTLPPSPRH